MVGWKRRLEGKGPSRGEPCTAATDGLQHCCYIGLLAMQSSASNAEPRIGVATSTRPNAEGVIGANSADAFAWQRALCE